jgi:hypothetical protein
VSVEEERKIAESRNDRVIVDRVSYARGWLARNETAEKELAEARAKYAAAVEVAILYRKELAKHMTLAPAHALFVHEEIDSVLAAKLASATDEGKRGKA